MIIKLTFVALAIVTTVIASAGQAQPNTRSAVAIPAQFHGRWAANPAACRAEHVETVITIDRRGYGEWERRADVTRVGQVRRGTHYFRVHNRENADETMGLLALRRDGPRIVITVHDDNAQPAHHAMIRCR